MTSEEYIKIFENSMKKFIKRAKLRQAYLASMLGVTSSAVSQMIKGRIIMSRAQLRTICEGLNLTQDEALDMQTLLTRIRDGESDYRTPFNRFMTMSRRQNKLSIQRLSQLTKISQLRLRSFEKDINVDFTADDAEKMSRIYNCTPEFMLQKLNFGLRSVEYGSISKSGSSEIEVSDNRAAFDTRQKIYVVRLKDFSEFSDNANLFSFAMARSYEEIYYDLGKEGVAIIADAKELGFAVPGDVVLFVTDKKPLTYVCRLAVCMDSNKKHHLLQKKEDGEKLYELTRDNELAEFTGKLRWALSVIEIKFIPKLLI
jgi:transcriptional regulator with XRE-family HTH domain